MPYLDYRRSACLLFILPLLMLTSYSVRPSEAADPCNATLADAQGLGTIVDNESSCPAPSFGATTDFTVGSSPEDLVVGDFNGDGKRDLAVANNGSANVSLLIGNGGGGFGSATNFP